jgi:[ribosomal protein S5]-alanine N-acetyltransferase
MKSKIPKSYQIETPRLRLRLPSEADIPFVFSATRFEGFNDGMVWEPPENEKVLLEPLKDNLNAWEEGTNYTFTIEEKESQKPLGRISIRHADTENTLNIGFWTHPESQGKGIMTEAVKGILKFGFEELSAKRIESRHALWNYGSEKVLKNNGLRFDKFLEQGFQKQGQWVETNLLGICKEEWLVLQ